MSEAGLPPSLSAILKTIPGVAGAGYEEGSLTIYLTMENETARAAVRVALDSLGVSGPVTFVVTGSFHFL